MVDGPLLRPAWAVADWLRIPRATMRSWYRRGRLATVACDVRTRALLVDYQEILTLRDTPRRHVLDPERPVEPP